MIVRRIERPRRGRSGHAAAELAVLLLPLCLICLMAVDYARMMNAVVTITNCARNGALYLSNPASYPAYSNVTGAATADAGALNPNALTVAAYPDPSVVTCWPPATNWQATWPADALDSYGNPFVKVTVSYTFTTLVNYPGIPPTTPLSRSVYMPVVN